MITNFEFYVDLANIFRIHIICSSWTFSPVSFLPCLCLCFIRLCGPSLVPSFHPSLLLPQLFSLSASFSCSFSFFHPPISSYPPNPRIFSYSTCSTSAFPQHIHNLKAALQNSVSCVFMFNAEGECEEEGENKFSFTNGKWSMLELLCLAWLVRAMSLSSHYCAADSHSLFEKVLPSPTLQNCSSKPESLVAL